MKRNIAALVLFAVLIAVSAAQLCLLKHVTGRFTGLTAECEQSVNMDSSELDERLAALCDYWQEYYDTVSFLTRSDSLEDMAADMSRLRTLTDGAELTGELCSLRTRAGLIYDEQVPHPRSVF